MINLQKPSDIKNTIATVSSCLLMQDRETAIDLLDDLYGVVADHKTYDVSTKLMLRGLIGASMEAIEQGN